MIYVNESGQYLLYADYAHMGLAKSRTRYSAFLDPKSDGRQRNFTTMAFEERIAGRLAHRQGDTILNMVTYVAAVGYSQDGAVPIFLGD